MVWWRLSSLSKSTLVILNLKLLRSLFFKDLMIKLHLIFLKKSSCFSGWCRAHKGWLLRISRPKLPLWLPKTISACIISLWISSTQILKKCKNNTLASVKVNVKVKFSKGSKCLSKKRFTNSKTNPFFSLSQILENLLMMKF